MSARRELAAFALVLGSLLAGYFGESLFGGKVLSPADVLFVSASFREVKGPSYEPSNRLLMDPVLQFQPWIEFNRSMLRAGRLPLWNSASGCGTPHLANGQSAPFDPFQLIAYLGSLPRAYAWMAAARLGFAGLGMFLLCRAWGFGPWGRWFAGLSYPFCGFLVLWLLFPVTNVAVWMPWLFLASDRVLERPGLRRIGVLALASGGAVLGGHIQTSAQVLLAVGLYVVWRMFRAGNDAGIERPARQRAAAWAGGIALGMALASVSIVPLGVYLTKSPVWTDRAKECPSPWQLTRPRMLDAVCTVVPYVFGSQRRGHPNLARALGVNNLNEAAGGYAGLATVLWLAPQAWGARKRQPRVAFLTALTAVGFLGAFGFPPVANVLRAVPVLDVMDQRRLTLWVAFGLVLLGGIGIDRLAAPAPGAVARWWVSLWATAGLGLLLLATIVARSEPWLMHRAREHYAQAAATTDGADPALYQQRAERQVSAAVRFLPVSLGLTAGELLALAALASLVGRGAVAWPVARGALAGLTLCELLAFGIGLNPAIEPGDDRPVTPLVARLRAVAGESGRILGLGEEWPPNVAMRYGLADPRNYDSVELTRSLAWLASLYETGNGVLSSRRTVTWAGVIRARQRLAESGVVAVVGASPPPPALAAEVERVGDVWLARLATQPRATLQSGREAVQLVGGNGRLEARFTLAHDDILVIRETYDPGWRAAVDGHAAVAEPWLGVFLAVRLGAGAHHVTLTYDPPEVRVAIGASLAALAATLLALTGALPARSARFRLQGLGRSRAIGLESNSVSSTGLHDRSNTEG